MNIFWIELRYITYEKPLPEIVRTVPPPVPPRKGEELLIDGVSEAT